MITARLTGEGWQKLRHLYFLLLQHKHKLLLAEASFRGWITTGNGGINIFLMV